MCLRVLVEARGQLTGDRISSGVASPSTRQTLDHLPCRFQGLNQGPQGPFAAELSQPSCPSSYLQSFNPPHPHNREFFCFQKSLSQLRQLRPELLALESLRQEDCHNCRSQTGIHVGFQTKLGYPAPKKELKIPMIFFKALSGNNVNKIGLCGLRVTLYISTQVPSALARPCPMCLHVSLVCISMVHTRFFRYGPG